MGKARSLRGVHCRVCGFVSVPAQTFGCLQCGAHGDDLPVVELNPHGLLLAAVTVYQHPNSAIAAPLVIGSVHLSDGPVVRARLDGDLPAGVPVVAEVTGDDVVQFIADDSKEIA
ncbi:Zn-ribbon domain-containing OB-fold protein [Cumulibacter manganitolerans]|uniref:Zn-ribbon domain-containing OB-fold protein n=1 Tax=Cumulibacter manganitolerans TaxID=1884992 RepID=UPI0012977A1E|nr:hypothetical protein [Cumulibacter manganitolerans]